MSKTFGSCEQFAVEADNSTIFEFYCTGQCSESDVTFWYRQVVLSLVIWCIVDYVLFAKCKILFDNISINLIGFFYYRFTVCPYESYDDNELWCSNLVDDYPSSLLTIPFINTTPKKPVVRGGATTQTTFNALTLFLLILAPFYNA